MEKNYSIQTRNLIALCHIINDYEEFERRLLEYISPKYNRDFVADLFDISYKKKHKLGARKAKQFYNENKAIIDTINRYSNISMFINLSYGFHGEKEEEFQFFYKYISEHKDELDKILAILEKLKKLGFDKIEFNEELDFTKDKHYVYPRFRSNILDMEFTDNQEVIPTYKSDVVEYKSTGSNYLMKLGTFFDDFSEYGRKIFLNNLTFDPSRLPDKISKESLFDTLLDQADAVKEKRTKIRSSVDLGVSISDLEKQYFKSSKTIARLNDVKNKEELIEVLNRIKAEIETLKLLSSKHDESVTAQEPELSKEVLDSEKHQYLLRREAASIHWD